MANNRIGCSSGKTKLIDPNNFYGQTSSNNMSVPLEDLTISVQLTTNKKGRTVLSSNNSINTAQSSNTVRVTFIEGTEVNGQKVLTSKFTDLTTVFDKDTPNGSSENLGITNIDIDFNSSYAPMVTINFIDLRGSSIFQNESQLNNSENKYSVFFQLPYPLYELTIKGYYGKPVKYCLHMTKFNSKFNSQTGNFEITASFIGYTYAMLSDMLLGILKAIPYTDKGKKKYAALKSENENTLNLNELMIKIGQIDINLNKIGANDPDAASKSIIDIMLEDIDLMKRTINGLGTKIDYLSDLTGEEAYKYIVIKNLNKLTEIDKTKAKNEYNEVMTQTIERYNKNNRDASARQPITLSYLLTTSGTKIKQYINKNFSVPEDITNKVIDRKSEAINDTFVIWDMGPLFSELNLRKTGLEIEKKRLELKLGETIKKDITKALSFEPTVRNIVNVFTDAVEVFLSVIYDVSHEAENHKERDGQLKKAFTENGNSDLKNFVKYFPWPDYRHNDAKNGYVEKYLGSPGVLENPKLVDELLFIDDLYNAFLTAKKISDEALLEQQQGNLWVPTNPFDTKIYNNKEPYDRLPSNTSGDDIIIYILIRMVTFMGYTHDSKLITSDSVKTMATADAKNLISSNTLAFNSKTRVQLLFGNVDDVISKAITEGVIAEDGNNYRYRFIFGDSPNKVLPISDSFKKEDWTNSYAFLTNKEEDDNTVFLTNYTREGTGLLPKKLDGGKYIDIIPLSIYEKAMGKGISEPIANVVNIITYKELADKKGYSIFNGIYAEQEFKRMNYDDNNNPNRSSMGDSPLSYLFYQYKYNGSALYQYGNLLTFGRSDNTKAYQYDLETPKPKIAEYYNSLKFDDSGNRLHKLGVENNRYLLTFNDNEKISYPYIEQIVETSYGKYVGMSLFGSKLYYNQRNSNSNTKDAEFKKAFLFLNTLPFDGYVFNGGVIDNLFNQTGGFIYAPRLWCAWVGSLIWRSGLNEKNFNFGKTNTQYDDPIDYPLYDSGNGKMTTIYKKPARYEYFKNKIMVNDSNQPEHDLVYYSDMFRNLPQQVLETFYGVFYSFVVSQDSEYTSWNTIKNNLELLNNKIGSSDETDYYSTYSDFKGIVDGLYNKSYVPSYSNTEIIITTGNGVYEDETVIPYKEYIDKFINVDHYSIITPIGELASNIYYGKGIRHNDGLFLELKGGMENPAIENVVNALREETIIVNSGFGAWNLEPTINNTNRQDIVMEKSLVKTYLETMKVEIDKEIKETAEAERQNKQNVFGTDNDEIVKLQLYRTCKNVYDKWVGNATDGNNVIFQCGGGKPVRHKTDKYMAQKRGSNTPKLIDSFRFVTRSFRDIGDDFFVDPRPIGTYLTDNPNSSFYDCITNLLAANNFDFIALPSFINYNDKESLESIFDTYTYEEAIKDGICGPSFVCVYIGQKSKHLDFNGSEYDNDGFDVQCLPNGDMKPTLPKDLTVDSKDYENDVAVFKVAYSQQNQNIFKDIILDQSEFTETEESLKIIDDISKTGSENQRHFGGQNLYSVYGVRSYKTEVEMMGNAMIQPMMYFQLDNIPMFHGAYLITHVKHNIKPNFMSTNFTGVRVRHPETPILDAAELYMSLLENIEITATNTSASAVRTKTVAELVPLISVKQFTDNKDIKYVNY
jgi:hypothetical protein